MLERFLRPANKVEPEVEPVQEQIDTVIVLLDEEGNGVGNPLYFNNWDAPDIFARIQEKLVEGEDLGEGNHYLGIDFIDPEFQTLSQ